MLEHAPLALVNGLPKWFFKKKQILLKTSFDYSEYFTETKERHIPYGQHCDTLTSMLYVFTHYHYKAESEAHSQLKSLSDDLSAVWTKSEVQSETGNGSRTWGFWTKGLRDVEVCLLVEWLISSVSWATFAINYNQACTPVGGSLD